MYVTTLAKAKFFLCCLLVWVFVFSAGGCLDRHLWGAAVHCLGRHASPLRCMERHAGCRCLQRHGGPRVVAHGGRSCHRPLGALASTGGCNMDRLLGRLATVPDAQLVHHLLRSCVDACRVNHLLRATNPTHSAPHATKAESAILAAFEGILRVTLQPPQRAQVSLPLRMGGCGVKSPMASMLPARVSALASFYGGGGARVGAPAYLLAPDPDLLREPLLGLQDTLGTSFDPLAAWVQDGSRILGATAEQRTQHWWGEAVARRLRQDLLDLVSNRDQARLLELADGVGTCWMTVPPSSAARTVISSDDYCLAMRWHLGLPLVPAPAPCPGLGGRRMPSGTTSCAAPGTTSPCVTTPFGMLFLPSCPRTVKR